MWIDLKIGLIMNEENVAGVVYFELAASAYSSYTPVLIS